MIDRVIAWSIISLYFLTIIYIFIRFPQNKNGFLLSLFLYLPNCQYLNSPSRLIWFNSQRMELAQIVFFTEIFLEHKHEIPRLTINKIILEQSFYFSEHLNLSSLLRWKYYGSIWGWTSLNLLSLFIWFSIINWSHMSKVLESIWRYLFNVAGKCLIGSKLTCISDFFYYFLVSRDLRIFWIYIVYI